MSELSSAIRQDLNKSTGSERALLLGTAALMALHQVGMEAALGFSAGLTLDSVHNPLLAPFAVGAVMGGLSRGTEEVITQVASRGVDKFDNVSGVMEERKALTDEAEAALQQIDGVQDDTQSGMKQGLQKLSKGYQRTSVIVGLGSSGAILRQQAIAPQSEKENIKTGKQAAKFLMYFNFGLGTIVAGSAKLLDLAGINASENIAAVATSPKTWGAFFVTGRMLGYADHRKKKAARRQYQQVQNVQ